ncbi:hypothetical protein [Streptacidiphilus rugosus]|uniref:hypothetical protein n=1 Tax=Streptacidiphilus rugosus TaxID=405783 RepID=UPI0006919200|nr:hypothetical protein [Streptacidiphilus rugosus]
MYVAVRGLGVLLVCWWGWAHGIAPVTRLGTLWDAGWYARIVDHGYAASDGLIGAHGVPFSPRAFFPLYPGVARLVAEATGLRTAGALVLTAWLASAAAACGIFAVADRLRGRRVGLAAVVLWGALPLAAVESMGYSESLFTALCAWCLYALLRARWLTAGLLCLLAGLARPSATALIAAVMVAAALEMRRTRAWRWRPVLAAGLAPLGWLGYIGYVSLAEGSLAGYFRIQTAWGTRIDGGWSTLCWYGDVFTHLFADHEARHHAFGRLPIAVTGLVYLALLVVCLCGRAPRRQPAALLVFGAGMMTIDFVNSSPVPPIARFLVPAFTLLLPAAQWLAARPALGRWLLTAAAIGSACYSVSVTFHGGAPS